MKTGFKFTLFTVSLILLLCCTAGAFLLVIAPTNRLQADYDAFSALDTSLAELQIELYRATACPFEDELPALEKASSLVSSSLDRIGSGSFIKSRNADVSSVVSKLSGSVGTLKADTDAVIASYRNLGELSRRAFGSAGKASTASFMDGEIRPLDSALLAEGRTAALAFTPVVIRQSDAIASVRAEIVARLPDVAQGIRNYRTLSFIVSSLIIICTWFLGLVAVWLLSLSVSRTTKRFSAILDSVANGNIGNCLEGIPADTSDELLGRMTAFIGNLRGIIGSVKDEAAANVESSTNLSASIGNTASTFEVVDGFIADIRKEVGVLEEQVKIVKTGLERVTSGLSHLDSGINNQKSVVEGSMVSVNGMISSINEMAVMATHDEKVVQNLVRSSENGQSLFSSTHQKINKISDSISRINGMAEVIENIAEQTNMLALNAAIEAAHAGDSGKGFAVVAEEITKLADASSESSRDIAESIEEIVENITSMADSSGLLDRAFEEMTREITLVYQTMSNFSSGLNESSRNSQQVLETMNALEDVSNGVTRDSGIMSEGAGAIAKSMSELDMISSQVFDGITAMSLMLDGLKEGMNEFKQLADKMNRSGLSINEHLAQLK